jgi:hypothetical protein
MLPVDLRRETLASPRVSTPRSPATSRTHPAPDPEADAQIAAEERDFDRMLMQRSELEREANALRDLALAQAKRDDAAMREWIKLI